MGREKGKDKQGQSVDTEDERRPEEPGKGFPLPEPSPEPREKGEFGEEYGNNLGYGREGEFPEPMGHPSEDNNDYIQRFYPSTEPEPMLDAEPAGEDHPTSGQPADERTMVEVRRLLVENNLFNASDINVHVVDGVVYLTGVTNTDLDARRAEALAETAQDAVRVVNELKWKASTKE